MAGTHFFTNRACLLASYMTCDEATEGPLATHCREWWNYWLKKFDILNATIQDGRHELKLQVEALQAMNNALESQKEELVAEKKSLEQRLETAKREIAIHEREYQKLLKKVEGAGNE